MNVRRYFGWLLASMLLVAMGAVQAQPQQARTQQARTQDRVVYHIDNSELQATKGLRNVRNHLDVAPNTKIVVVTHAEGIDFLMEGARDRKNPDIQYAPLVSALTARGVVFEICEITLRNRNLKRQFVMDAQFTPSGVARIAQLQLHEGYAYIKP